MGASTPPPTLGVDDQLFAFWSPVEICYGLLSLLRDPKSGLTGSQPRTRFGRRLWGPRFTRKGIITTWPEKAPELPPPLPYLHCLGLVEDCLFQRLT